MKKKILAFILAILITASLLPTAAFALEPADPAQSTDPVIFQDVDTLMIYNPYLGDYEYTTPDTTDLSTGDMSGQISTSIGNVGYSKTIPEERELFYFDDQRAFPQELEGVLLYRNEASVNEELNESQVYQVDDTRTFMYEGGVSASFTCLYAGTYCYVWGGAGYSRHTNKAIAQLMGQEFDEKVYANDVNSFGSARFIKDGGKLNILVYDMNSTGLCGYFRPVELLAREDLGDILYIYYSSIYHMGEATIHVNSYMCSSSYYESVGMVTLAHEFQHLICFSSTLLGNGANSLTEMGTWLNEAMSMQAEEISYPGEVAKQGYISYSYNLSGDIAGGQSLYDFATNNDIGVYGQVFMFSEYLKEQYGGKEVFKDIHSYWREESASKLTDADVLSAVLPEPYYNALDADIVYPEALENSIGSEEENTLSKLNLAFQISTVLQDESGIYSLGDGCGLVAPKLYTSNSCSIPGGGRIYVKTADGNSYTVPSDADADLIYVGFKNGEMTIEPTQAADYVHEAEDGLSLGAATVNAGTSTQKFTITSAENRSAVLLVVRLDSNGRQVDYQYKDLLLKKGNNTAKVSYTGNITGTNLLAFLVSSDTWTPIVERTEWTFTT